jgi:ribonuclease J
VRIIPLGGVEEIGRNMCVVETGPDIFVVDAGFQFVSPDENPGVDYLLPNPAYLEENAVRIRAVLITHGHLDHVGAIPFLMDRIGNPPIYTQQLSAVIIRRRQEEYPDAPALNIIEVENFSRHAIGGTHVQFFPVTHSIPDAMGVAIETPYGNVIFTGDLKVGHENGVPVPHEVKMWSALGAQKNLLFVSDSTNADSPGFSIPEPRVRQNLDEIMQGVHGRLVIGVISTQLERMINLITTAERLGKKVVPVGRSIQNNIEIAQKTGLLRPQPGTIIRMQDTGSYASDKLVILATGAQGEEFGALTRIATKQHKYISFTERDTIVLSSSVIPGNELSVQRLKDLLYRHTVTLIHYRSDNVHSSGHGNASELAWLDRTVNAQFFMPAHGYYSKTSTHAKVVEQAGRARESTIVADNGMVIDIVDGERLEIHEEKVPSDPLAVDGFAVGARQEPVIRDRLTLAKEGMFIVVVTVDGKTGRLRKSPDIISRGFVYLRESQPLLHESRLLVKRVTEHAFKDSRGVDDDRIRDEIADAVIGFLFQKTNKVPIVIPVLIRV